MEKVYKDKYGYLRFLGSGIAVHRAVYYEANPEVSRRWHVHHINGNKLDNEIGNLIALPPQTHNLLHKFFSFPKLPNRESIAKWIARGCKDPKTERDRKRAYKFAVRVKKDRAAENLRKAEKKKKRIEAQRSRRPPGKTIIVRKKVSNV